MNTGVNFILICLISLTISSLQEPHPSQIRPESGPQAGGTTLTITGTNLATGSKKDVQVSVGSQPCNVYVPWVTNNTKLYPNEAPTFSGLQKLNKSIVYLFVNHPMQWSSARNIQTETHSEAPAGRAAVKATKAGELRYPKIFPVSAFSAWLTAPNPPMLSLSISSVVPYKIAIF